MWLGPLGHSMAASEVAPAAERAELELTFHRGMRVLLGNWSAMRLLVQEGGSAKHPLLGLQELEDELHFNFEEKCGVAIPVALLWPPR